ncbi:MAG TPA: DUF1573 domain-containing protein [Pirellulaceae bacterium]|nr:DUF1573 domain-containing protein [Pirellulaceae bacterium]
MRLPLVVIVIAILGGSLGIAQTWREFSGVEERMELPASVRGDGGVIANSSPTNPAPVDATAAPLAKVVGESSNDFGIIGHEESKSHSFVIRNDGDADLLLEKQNVSCGLCVQTTFTSAVVKPGDTVTIPVSLAAKKPGPALSENLEVRTNDKSHEVIRFDLTAYISEAAGASVSELAFGTISTDAGGAASFRVYGFAEQPLEIVECKLNGLDNQDYVEWEVVELTPDAVKTGQSHANSGKEITVTLKPGLPVGPLKQSLTIVARAGEQVTINVPLSGRVAGDISLIGGSTFTPDRNVLSLGRILRGEGTSTKLHMMVKGTHREDVRLTVGECDPAEFLSATIGERKPIRDGEVYLYPVVVEIGKDAPSMNRLGGVEAEYGKIMLHTTHPTAKEVILYVRFAVE